MRSVLHGVLTGGKGSGAAGRGKGGWRAGAGLFWLVNPGPALKQALPIATKGPPLQYHICLCAYPVCPLQRGRTATASKPSTVTEILPCESRATTSACCIPYSPPLWLRHALPRFAAACIAVCHPAGAVPHGGPAGRDRLLCPLQLWQARQQLPLLHVRRAGQLGVCPLILDAQGNRTLFCWGWL